jgi:hypothetical protein
MVITLDLAIGSEKLMYVLKAENVFYSFIIIYLKINIFVYSNKLGTNLYCLD